MFPGVNFSANSSNAILESTSFLLPALYYSLTRGVKSHRESGVPFMFTVSTRWALKSWKPLSGRILMARFRFRISDNSIVQYYPKRAASDTESKRFSRSNSMQSRRGFLIIIDDLNANVGSDNTLFRHVIGKCGLRGL